MLSLDEDMIVGIDPVPMIEFQLTVYNLNQEVIFETQFNPSNIEKANMYHDIVACIRLESPTSSYGTRIKIDSNRFPSAQLINTPIRNSAGLPNSHGKTYINS